MGPLVLARGSVSTLDIETALSFPGRVSEYSERAARMSRRELYSGAPAEYLARQTENEVIRATIDSASSDAGLTGPDASSGMPKPSAKECDRCNLRAPSWHRSRE
jgi:hypothetical protein